MVDTSEDQFKPRNLLHAAGYFSVFLQAVCTNVPLDPYAATVGHVVIKSNRPVSVVLGGTAGKNVAKKKKRGKSWDQVRVLSERAVLLLQLQPPAVRAAALSATYGCLAKGMPGDGWHLRPNVPPGLCVVVLGQANQTNLAGSSLASVIKLLPF